MFPFIRLFSLDSYKKLQFAILSRKTLKFTNIFPETVTFWPSASYTKQRGTKAVSRIEAWTAAPKAQPTENMRKGRVEFMTTSITSFYGQPQTDFWAGLFRHAHRILRGKRRVRGLSFCAKAQPAFYKSVPAVLPPTSEGHRTLCAAQPVSSFLSSPFRRTKRGNFAHFAQNCLCTGRYLPARRTSGRANAFFIFFRQAGAGTFSGARLFCV